MAENAFSDSQSLDVLLSSLNSRLARDVVRLNACICFVIKLLQGRPACSKSSFSSQAVLLVVAESWLLWMYGPFGLGHPVIAWDMKCYLCLHACEPPEG